MMMMMMMQGQPNFKPVSSGSALELHPQGNALMCIALTKDVPSCGSYVQLQCNSATPYTGGEEVSLLVSGSAKSTQVLSLLASCSAMSTSWPQLYCPHLAMQLYCTDVHWLHWRVGKFRHLYNRVTIYLLYQGHPLFCTKDVSFPDSSQSFFYFVSQNNWLHCTFWSNKNLPLTRSETN